MFKSVTQECVTVLSQKRLVVILMLSGLFLTLHDGSKLYVDNVADKVIEFWKKYFEKSSAKFTSSE